MNARAHELVESIMDEFLDQLVDLDTDVSAAIAQTNANGFAVDSYNVTSAEFRGDEIRFAVEGAFKGSQEPEKPAAGDSIRFEIEGDAAHNGEKWYVIDYNVVSCSPNFE